MVSQRRLGPRQGAGAVDVVDVLDINIINILGALVLDVLDVSQRPGSKDG